MTLASQGAQARIYVEPDVAPHTFDTSSERYEFLSEDLKAQGVIVHPNSIRGTRSPCTARSRKGPYTVSGPIQFVVTPAWLDAWLPRILGEPESSDVFALAETLPAFGVLIDRVAQRFQYTDCYVNRAVFRPVAIEGKPTVIVATLYLLGKTEVLGTSVPNVSLDCSSTTHQPYLFSDTAITLVGSSRTALNFALVIDNHLEPRFANSLTATSITPTDRSVILRTVNPYTADELDLYDQAATGTAGSMVWTNGNMSCTWTFAALTPPKESPTVTGKKEIPLFLTHVARRTSDNAELVVTNDSTP